ncbi:MAG: hypothetical protein H7Y03_06840 [Chitinophagaceae bacterium]|nr:hypothetical protein [Chitinophagaceae bacterium]
MTPNIKIVDLQKRFQEEYTYLHLRFFRILSPGEGFATIKKFCDPDSEMGAALKMKKHGQINISGTMKVSELVEEFYNTYGIHAQVFRKSANLWMEITLTNNWTLTQQNNHGREISVQ